MDLDNKTVKIPKNISEHFLNKVPRKITLYGIDPEYDIELGKKRIYRPISGSININEYENIKDFKDNVTARKANSNDMKNISKIVQKLDLIQYNATAVLPGDVPENAMDITAEALKQC